MRVLPCCSFNLQVLDDWLGEAAEIYAHNPWLNYPELMHHVREMGFSHPLFDLIDERRLDVSELLKFLELIFGESCYELPDPRVDCPGFLEAIAEVVADAGNVIAISEKFLVALNKGHTVNVEKTKVVCEPAPWINLKQLKRCYDPKSSTCVIS